MIDATPIAITMIGGPTVLIEINGVRIVTDPTFDAPGVHRSGPITLEKTEGPALSPEQVGPVDAVLLSHDQHADNFDTSGRAFAATAKVVLTTEVGHQRIGGNSFGLQPWQSRAIGNRGQLTVTASPARHGPPGVERTLGDVVGFVIAGPKKDALVYVTGDTVYYDGVAEVARWYKPRVVVVFAGAARTRGPFNLTMGNNDVLELARAFPAARIVVVHNRGWAHFTEGPASITSAVTPFALGGRVGSLAPGDRVVFDDHHVG